ncbi:hypothetical protein NDU88_002383 [Pleurodeles waltl]|uniref:Uncharacterized protein n=1 Tax=Pleurodeles waltl TaxID=8319 RepID=A0AAV7Q8M5_PLEWA|nr:hypothetical protein NDU88_002383 [Pleurodeles waltl]
MKPAHEICWRTRWEVLVRRPSVQQVVNLPGSSTLEVLAVPASIYFPMVEMISLSPLASSGREPPDLYRRHQLIISFRECPRPVLESPLPRVPSLVTAECCVPSPRLPALRFRQPLPEASETVPAPRETVMHSVDFGRDNPKWETLVRDTLWTVLDYINSVYLGILAEFYV